MSSVKGRRLFSIIAFLIFLMVEILIGKYASGWLRNSFGDVIVILLLYSLVRIFTDRLERTLPLVLFGFACFVELMQYFDICGILGIPKDSLLAVIIGTTGLWGDVLCYGAGALLLYVWLILKKSIERSRNNG